MVGVTIDSGPVEAEDLLRSVPQDKWRELMLARRRFLEIKLSYDCRCLVQFVNDAELMFSALGFESADAMIREGYALKAEEIRLAVEWLELNPPADPIGLPDVAKRAARAQELDAKDRENQRPAHKHIDRDVYAETGDVHVRPTGNTAAAALRRLRKDRPDIHARVLSGEISANAGMVEAGFRKPRRSTKRTPLDQLRHWWKRASEDERAAFREEI